MCESDSDTLNGLSLSAVGIGGGRRLWASAVVVVGERQWGVSVGNGSSTLSADLGGCALCYLWQLCSWRRGSCYFKRERCVITLTLFDLAHLTVCSARVGANCGVIVFTVAAEASRGVQCHWGAAVVAEARRGLQGGGLQGGGFQARG